MCRIANACYRPKAYDMWWHLFHSDGLVDCMDPDCCTQSSCVTNPLCRGSRDPLQVIQQSQSEVQKVPSFYDRIKMLVGKDSTHIIPGINPFNARYLICHVLWWTKLLNLSCSNIVFLCACSLASLIRGQVLTSDDTPLVGVNVTFVKYPHYGHTMTRQDGTWVTSHYLNPFQYFHMQLNMCWSIFPVPVLPSFDLVANGGGSLTLRFERAPFLSQERTVWLPWNRFYTMDTVVLQTEEKTTARCDLSGFVRPDPMVLPSPLSSFFSSNPSERHILPESQVPHSTLLPSFLISFMFT